MATQHNNYKRRGRPSVYNPEDQQESPRDSENLVDAATRPIEAFTSGQTAMQVQVPHLTAFDCFCKQHPPLFDGKGTKLDADNWLEHLEKIFSVISCTEEQKVEIAAYNLADVANGWWKATRGFIQQELGEATPISWNKFKEAFNDWFFPVSIREAKAREFADLKQGTMTVRQYASKFVELSRFAPHLVHTEALKAEKFERGLNPRIMDSLLALKIRKFADLEDRVVILEENLRVRAGEFNQRKRPFYAMEQNKGKRPMYSPMPKPIQVVKPPQRGTTAPHPACQNYGKRHAGKCLMGTNICFKCGILPLFSHRALVLFDSGATHSFISRKYACLSERAPEPLEPVMSVSSPLGKSMICQFVLKGCAIKIQD
ncbi:uncharacterized protein LOC122282266 [Carya illinoinensis]|uniref:uncharacterized protein LOC122282266 n=1 Tax=Carya illinoinensis TaxID=32201 RepID=UPI001C71946D|nr:uncharacterized protein LOC122282266 [Carya illinoinensis]